jgi:hypothetical protein
MAITKGIGIISTIKYAGTNLVANFRRGVDNDAWCDAAPPLDRLGYDDGPLQTAVGQHNRDGNVGLIVTVGGVASARAALRWSQKPFLSLYGDPIGADFPGQVSGGNFWGGIVLHTFLNNDERVTHLKGPPHRFSDGQICLLSNPRSVYAAYETGQWPSPPRGRILYASTKNEIDAAFDTFAKDGSLAAMIISADGFFQDNKDTIVDDANTAGKYVAYPFQIYSEAGVHPTHHYTLHGPKLASAYYDLGQKAADVITHSRASDVKKADTEVHDK